MKFSAIAVPVLTLLCIIVPFIGYDLGVTAGRQQLVNENRFQAAHFCNSVGLNLRTVAYQAKAERWSIQCK